MSADLRVSLWNLFVELYGRKEYWRKITVYIARFYRIFPVDELPFSNHENRDWVKEYFFGLSWYGAYNFLEFIVNHHQNAMEEPGPDGRSVIRHPVSTARLEIFTNGILEQELSGYRFVAHVLTPISDTVELDEVHKAATELRNHGLAAAQAHIHAALELFSKRPKPDYRNAVKESISAIESIARQLGANDGDGLSTALRALDEKTKLHGALRGAFEKLYGYTSDEAGIRHAMLEEPNVGFEEAKYMIVACSAFANYLASKAQAAGLVK